MPRRDLIVAEIPVVNYSTPYRSSGVLYEGLLGRFEACPAGVYSLCTEVLRSPDRRSRAGRPWVQFGGSALGAVRWSAPPSLGKGWLPDQRPTSPSWLRLRKYRGNRLACPPLSHRSHRPDMACQRCRQVAHQSLRSRDYRPARRRWSIHRPRFRGLAPSWHHRDRLSASDSASGREASASPAIPEEATGVMLDELTAWRAVECEEVVTPVS